MAESHLKKKKKKNAPWVITSSVLLMVLVILGAVMIKARSADVRRADEAQSAQEVSVTPSPEPAVETSPTVSLCGVEYPADTKELVITGSVSPDELSSAIGEFTALESIDAEGCGFTDSEKRALVSSNPQVTFIWTVDFDGTSISSASSALAVPSPESVELYASRADLLPGITDITLDGGDYTPEQAGILAKAWPSAVLNGTITMFGQSFSTEETELDFSETKISLDETERFSSLVAAMPCLEKVIMTDCGLSDEEMDALNKSYDSVQFVWTVYFRVYSVRTDADHFCVSDLPWNGYVCWPLTDEQFAPLKYCHDLIALDLGHENVSDLSFVYDMPKLQYLIVATVHNKLDLTPLASLKDLYYLEVFHNEIEDLTPLLECRNLRHLNIGNCSGDFSIEPLYQMTYLERLWFPMNHLTEEEKTSLVEALPDVNVYLGSDDEVGGGWRTDETYYELKEALHMPT